MIYKLKPEHLGNPSNLGGVNEIYPVTSTKAVYLPDGSNLNNVIEKLKDSGFSFGGIIKDQNTYFSQKGKIYHLVTNPLEGNYPNFGNIYVTKDETNTCLIFKCINDIWVKEVLNIPSESYMRNLEDRIDKNTPQLIDEEDLNSNSIKEDQLYYTIE